MNARRAPDAAPAAKPRRAGAPGEPRDYTVSGGLGYSGPTERVSRVAARQSFVDAKLLFMQALSTADMNQPNNDWLRKQVRSAQVPEDLWLLRSAVFAALRNDPQNGLRLREALRRSLDGMLPGTFAGTGFGSL
jgi:hypothetical protein